MTPEQLDALAAWWRAALDAQRATLTPGGPGWADLQAKRRLIERYEQARACAEATEGYVPGGTYLRIERNTFGWVMQRLAHAHHLDHPERDGWIDSWRPES